MAAQVYIGLGSNLGNTPADTSLLTPQSRIENAVAELKQLPQSQWQACSPLYRSAPVGPQDQPDYINAVAAVLTELAPESLLDALQAIELAQGRQRDGLRWGARTLDLDILLYGDRMIATSRLQVPHPEMAHRGFVLQPLHDLAPDIMIPEQGTVTELLSQMDPRDLIRL